MGHLADKIVLDACDTDADSPLVRNAEAASVAEAVAGISAGCVPCPRVQRGGRHLRRSLRPTQGPQARSADRPGDDPEAVRIAAQLVLDAGCEPVVVGGLASVAGFQRGGPGFRANTTALELSRVLGLTNDE